MKKLLILVVAVVFAFGCAPKGGPSKNPVLAKIKGAKITKEDYLKEFNRLPEWAKARFQSKEGKEQFLNELIKKDLLYNKAKKQGLERDKEYVSRLEEYKKMELISLLLKNEIEGKVKATDEDVKNFYAKHSSEFKAGEEVKASHILVDTEADVNAVYEKLRKGEDFSKLAKGFSKDHTTSAKGGDLGFFRHGQMVPEFEQFAFRLKVGEVSHPVRTRFGYHIIKVSARKEGTQLGFEQVKDSIKRRLISEKQKEIFDAFVEKLKKESNITIEKKALDEIQLPVGETQKPAAGQEPVEGQLPESPETK
ncbi:MAG: peptidylprolyl isomerase [Nitrospirae bacterium]|nr:peptidylprolyl isomerase [Nitrospirota bacterium]